jgi:two-component system, cell cycle sensor histidine kinase and response regulator CckA
MGSEAENGKQLVNELMELRSMITVLEAKLQALDETYKALRNREKRYRHIVDNANDIIYMTDAKGFFLIFNEAGLRTTGYSRDEITRMHYLDLIQPEYKKEVERFYGIQYVKRIPDTYYELPVITKQGKTIWIGQHIQLVAEDDGITGFQAIGRDITARRKAEEALIESEEKYRLLIESLPHAVIILQDSKLAFINYAGVRMFRWNSVEEALGTEDLAIASRKERDRISRYVTERLAGNSDIPGQYLTTLQRMDGEEFPAQVFVTLLDYKGGRAEQVVILDTTEQQQAERALVESELNYRALFQESRDAVVITSREGRVIDANHAFIELFGFNEEEVRNMDILRIYPDPEMRKQFQQDIEKTGSLKDYEVKRRRKDGTEMDCLISSTVRSDDQGNIIGYQGIISDITDRKRLEKELLHAQKMEAVGTLAGGIAHDFNNLLQVTMGYSELLLSEKKQTDPEYQDLGKILEAAQTGADLVQRLLAFSSKTEIKQRPISLNHQIEKAKKILSRTIPRMIEIELHLSDSLSPINADPAQIEQVIMNLALNARDAMPEGGRLTISTENTTFDDQYCSNHPGLEPGGHVLLTISDTGSGMDKETLENIFDPFFTTKAVGRGTGLGLAVVHGIVQQHGGDINCESEPGKGTIFRICFPALEEKLYASETSRAPIKLPRGTETILLVDDEDYVRDLGERILRRWGYNVLLATNGKEALEIYLKERDNISLVILDLIMPEMGGKLCMKELFEIDPTARILVASGYESGGGPLDARQAGAAGFIRKPFNVNQILQNVRKIIDS